MSSLRELERVSIRSFVESCAPLLSGRVLDYGCGDQRYRPIIEGAGGVYHGYDFPGFPGFVTGAEADIQDLLYQRDRQSFDTVLCTQIMQFVPDPCRTLENLRVSYMKPDAALVMTYTTAWPEVEEGDLHRHTKAGMTRLLVDAGFVIERHERRAEIEWKGEVFALGYGVVGRAA